MSDPVILEIEGRRVEVGREFLALPPDQQQRVVSEIAASLGVGARQQREQRPDVGWGEAARIGAAQGLTLGFADEIAAGVRSIPSAFGKEGFRTAYDRNLTEERRKLEDAREQYPMTTFSGSVLGSMAIPIPGAAVATLPRAVATGATYGAVSGFGEGEGGAGERLLNAAQGAAIGGAVGGALQRLTRPGAGQNTDVSRVTGLDAARAADNVGVELPRMYATDNSALRMVGAGLRAAPIVQDDIIAASQTLRKGVDEAQTGLVRELGSGDVRRAGGAARSGVNRYMDDLAQRANENYKAFSPAIPQGTVAPPSNTARAIAEIDALYTKDGNRIPLPEEARILKKSLFDENGNILPKGYEALNSLRGYIGSSLSKFAGADLQYMNRLYGALKDDMRDIVAAHVPDGARLFDRAFAFDAAAKARSSRLDDIVGARVPLPPERSLEVIAGYATNGSRADFQRLRLAKKAMNEDEWGEVGAAVLARMGRSRSDDMFDFSRYLKDWGSLDERSKALLFAPDHRAALDNIAKISRRVMDLSRTYGNPSGTAQVTGMRETIGKTGTAVGALAAAQVMPLVNILAGYFTASAMAKYLASPVTAKALERAQQLQLAAVSGGGKTAMLAFDRALRNLGTLTGREPGVFAREIIDGMYGKVPEDRP